MATVYATMARGKKSSYFQIAGVDDFATPNHGMEALEIANVLWDHLPAETLLHLSERLNCRIKDTIGLAELRQSMGGFLAL